jgi:hypothetical protein
MSLTSRLKSFVPSALLATIATISGLLPQASADAQSYHALRAASEEYRDVVLNFESHINTGRQFDKYDRRVADRLEDASGEFRSAARNPRDVERLLHHWNDVSIAHQLAERMVLGCGHPDPALLECWRPVAETYLCLVAEMRCFAGHGGHGGHGGHSSYRVPVDSYADQWNRGGLRQDPSRFDSGYPGIGFPGSVHPHHGGVYAPSHNPRALPPHVQPGYGRDFRSNGTVPPSDWRPDGRGGFQSNRQPAIEIRPADPRREVGAAIAATILNSLLNSRN